MSAYPSLPPSAPAFYPSLTGLRAVAAGLVFVHHYNPAPPGTFVHRLADQGYVGVSLFFVLSGFLIHHRYADAYLGRRHWSWRVYLQNRFVRLYPLYLLVLLATMCVAVAQNRPLSGGLALANLTLLKGISNTHAFGGIAQSWSLTAEFCFYALAPPLFALLNRRGAFCLTLVLTTTGLFLYATVGQASVYGAFGSVPFVCFYTFFGRSFEFVAGMWLARYGQRNRLVGPVDPLLVGLLIMGGCVVWQAALPTMTTDARWLFLSELVVYNYVLPVGNGLFILSLVRHPSVVSRLLSHPIMQHLGQSAYAFYLIHVGVVASGLRKAGVESLWLSAICLTGIAFTLFTFVEKPLYQRLKHRQP